MRAELEQVYCQHQQTLFALALTITGCAGLAEDSVHEAFVRLCRKDARPGGSLTAYVFASVRNAAIDLRRRQMRQQRLAESVFQDSADRLGLQARSEESSEQLCRLSGLIDVLEESVREIIVMKIFANLTFDEIGQVMGTPSATVATRYRRALVKLEEHLRRDS